MKWSVLTLAAEIRTGHEICKYPVYYQQDAKHTGRLFAVAINLFIINKMACPVLRGAYVTHWAQEQEKRDTLQATSRKSLISKDVL